MGDDFGNLRLRKPSLLYPVEIGVADASAFVQGLLFRLCSCWPALGTGSTYSLFLPESPALSFA